MQNLYERIQRMKAAIGDDTLLFCDITWGAGGSTSQLSMDIAIYMQQQLNITTNLHMTCTNMIAPTSADGAVDVEPIEPKKVIQNSIQTAIQHDVINIFALRGDPPVNADGSHSSTFVPIKDGFTCALDLVKFIRHPDTTLDGITNNTTQIGVGVAGYPEGHPVAITVVDDVSTMTESEKARSSFDFEAQTTYTCRDADYEKELIYLKEKVDAGAEFIITQMFFDTAVYIQFVHDCRAIGITCPILPGIMCINNVPGFLKMTKFCKTRIPPMLYKSMTETEMTPDELKQFGIQYGVGQCRAMMMMDTSASSPPATASLYEPPPVFHFYTLNLEKVVIGIIQELGYTLNVITDDAKE
jgi:methylenetetrahydrofolate reductase (NADPH)